MRRQLWDEEDMEIDIECCQCHVLYAMIAFKPHGKRGRTKETEIWKK